MTFPTEAERLRAREAAGQSACVCVGQHTCPNKDAALRQFDRLYPPVPDALAGLFVEADESVPPNEVHIRHKGKLVGKITDIALPVPDAPELATTSEADPDAVVGPAISSGVAAPAPFAAMLNSCLIAYASKLALVRGHPDREVFHKRFHAARAAIEQYVAGLEAERDKCFMDMVEANHEAAAFARELRAAQDAGEVHKVMRVHSHESAVDPTGRPYIKSMLVITSDLSVDQGREFRVSDGDRVRVVKVEP
jgi:hypothetical protein